VIWKIREIFPKTLLTSFPVGIQMQPVVKGYWRIAPPHSKRSPVNIAHRNQQR